MSKPSIARSCAAVIALIAWAALALQYALLIAMTSADIGPLLATLRFFSFFTVLSNLLVALTTTSAFVAPSSAAGEWLSQPRVRGAAALCIAITCAVYFFVLASTWAPQGAQLVADLTLHYVVPALYVLWWTVCVAHPRLVWRDALRWMMVPLAFLIWTLARGAWLHEYPYPFVDVDALGLATVARNACGLGLLFFAVGLLFIALDRRFQRKGWQ